MVAFAGRSNVGKSSLINSLLGKRKLARTSSTPGRTQTINFFNVEDRWIFVDLPGYGFAKVSKSVRENWGPMIEAFLTGEDRLKVVILILDARHAPTELDSVMDDFLETTGVARQLVATKFDKISSSRRTTTISRISNALGGRDVIPYSSATGIGKKELWQLIREV